MYDTIWESLIIMVNRNQGQSDYYMIDWENKKEKSNIRIQLILIHTNLHIYYFREILFRKL